VRKRTGHRLRIDLLTSCCIQPPGHPHDGPGLHQSKERLVNGCTRSCRQEVGTGEHSTLGLACDGLSNHFGSAHVRNYYFFSSTVNILLLNADDGSTPIKVYFLYYEFVRV
jgi:hypothetical protein